MLTRIEAIKLIYTLNIPLKQQLAQKKLTYRPLIEKAEAAN